MTLGKRLKELRIDKKISLGKLEEAVDISTSNLGDYENDNKNPTVERLKRIAEFYGVSLDYLAGITEVKSVDFSVRAICDEIGLSEAAVIKLQEDTQPGVNRNHDVTIKGEIDALWAARNRGLLTVLDALICHSGFWNCLQHLHEYIYPNNVRISSLEAFYKSRASDDFSPVFFREEYEENQKQLAFAELYGLINEIKKAEEVRNGDD